MQKNPFRVGSKPRGASALGDAGAPHPCRDSRLSRGFLRDVAARLGCKKSGCRGGGALAGALPDGLAADDFEITLWAGRKVVLALEDGQRGHGELGRGATRLETARRLRAPKLTVAGSDLGLWSALALVCPECAKHRCWNHQLRNVLDVVRDQVQRAMRANL